MIRGEVWWADLGIPFGSEPGFKRPVVIIQDDSFNRSNIQTIIVSSVTTNLNLADAPGNIFLEPEESGLPKNGVINISQISTIDKRRLIEKVSTLPPRTMHEVDFGLKLIFNIQ
ncbi:type II toxin-antitoxin system PemK/MazF family toxin [Thiospirochaeta perfilievii]|uniref:mRNA interferase n=1 Tax=Thiospirochaeta perfilievii TaxID=252967 RepID=A0A5C1Q9M7_9SPIO|nr:type II toxin-antitoxin system PemK/MazF family toxin [Thiospirochaeta perfilievii]QEN03344.1 type II toxin-antitoxin system PemK/MazF family toxin [Thiospirochaeta perfilievii]